MIFISFWFYIFVAVLVSIYYLLPLRFRWVSLLMGSLGFYWYLSQYSPRRFFVLVALALISWLLGKALGKDHKYRKALLTVSILADAIPLVLIKEGPFFLWRIGNMGTPAWWLIPVGISFFSLQLISYSVDVYSGRIAPEHHFLKFLLFVSFFPQIVQGPIPRYSQLSHQLTAGHRFDEKKFVKGFLLIIWGFFLKLCIADKAGVVVDQIFDHYPAYGGMYVLAGGFLYSIQLYTDFSACTSLAQGVSGLFGIDLINNFQRPYFAASIKDFWRRWHISLSSWLRDYIYIPLGGNRKGTVRKYINILLTFAVSGIWHGGGFKYLFWGLLHGGYQVVGDITTPLRSKIYETLNMDVSSRIHNAGKQIVTFFLVMLAWIIFRAEHLSTGLSMIRSIFTVHNPWILTNDALLGLGLGWKEFSILLICMLILLGVSIAQEKGIEIREKILNCNIAIRWIIYISAILFVVIFGTYGWGYDSQAFIYGGF